jgi:hypothetical protein
VILEAMSMKRFLMTRFLVCLLVSVLVMSGLIADPAQARSLSGLGWMPQLAETATPELVQDALGKLESEILPKLENILSPEQREQFQAAIAEGGSFRRTFKALNLTPEQKMQLGKLLKTLPKRDLFNSLSAEQKKQLFLKKKDLFAPTAAEFGD